MSRLASRRGPASDSGAYVPTRSEIEAQTAEFKQRKLEDLANLPDPKATERRANRERLVKSRRAEIEAAEAKIEANRFNEPDDYQPKYRVPVGPDGPREMSREDICNVGSLRLGDLDPIFDMVIDAATAQQEVVELNTRIELGGNPDDFDLADYDDEPEPPPFKGQKAFKPSGAFGVVG